MNTDPRRVATSRYLLDWILPALFALLVSGTIRFHSLEAAPTMARMVGNLLALAGAALLALLMLGRRMAVPRDIALPLLAFAAAAVVSVLGSGDSDASLLRLELYLAMGLFAVAVYLVYRDSNGLPLDGYLLAVGIVHVPFLLGAILWISALVPPFWQYGPRVADFAHVRQFGEFGFFAAASGTALGIVSRRLLVPSLLLGTAAVFGLVFTGCRGALLAWLLFLVLCCCLGRARLRAAALGGSTFAVAAVAVWYLDRSGLLPSPNIFGRLVTLAQASGEGFDSGRIALWLASLKQITVHPLFGSGPEGYWISGCCDRTLMQAHNFVLQFLLEFGVVGCGLVLLVAVRAVRRAGGLNGLRQLTCATSENRILGCLLVAYAAYSCIDQTMYHLVPLLHFALFAGLFGAGLLQASRAAAATPV